MDVSFRKRRNWVMETANLVYNWTLQDLLTLPCHTHFVAIEDWIYSLAGIDPTSPHRTEKIYKKFESGEIPIEAFHGPHGLTMFKAWMIRNEADKNAEQV